jgi:hypothetical protein
LLYGLAQDEVTEIWSTFHASLDYQPQLEAVMEHYERLRETVVD